MKKESLWVALISGLFTLVVGFLALYEGNISSHSSTQTELVEILYKRVGALEANQETLNKINKEQSFRITQLTIELSRKYESSQVLKNYMNKMPFPAWIKVVEDKGDDPEFKMWHINKKYEDKFGVTRERYLGRTDFEVWPASSALSFYKADIEVYKSLGSNCGKEHLKYTPLGPKAEPVIEDITVCKWSTTVDGKSAVAGQLIGDG